MVHYVRATRPSYSHAKQHTRMSPNTKLHTQTFTKRVADYQLLMIKHRRYEVAGTFKAPT
jgi:hypothetical protein